MENKIEYQFIAMPTKLSMLLDSNCTKVLLTLIQASNYYTLNEQGFFYLTKETICDFTDLSVNVVTAVIDTLYINGIISIQTVGKSKGKYVNHYRINVENFSKYDALTFEDIKNPDNRIKTVKYKNNYQPQYIKDYLEGKEGRKKVITTEVENMVEIDECKEQRKQERKKVITNINNKDNIYNINNNIIKDNNNKKENNNIIIEEKKEYYLNDEIWKKIKEAESVDDSAPVKKRRKNDYTICPSNDEINEWEDKWLDSFIPMSVVNF